MVCLAFLPICTFAQTVTTLNGLVTDPTGSAIPGANLVLVSKDTNAQRETVSDDSGRYQFPALTPGLYQLKATKAGFSSVSIQDVRLLVNTPATINIAFETVGSVA